MTRAASSGKQRAVHFYIIDFFQGTNPKDKRSANSVWVCRSILYDFRKPHVPRSSRGNLVKHTSIGVFPGVTNKCCIMKKKTLDAPMSFGADVVGHVGLAKNEQQW